MLERHEVQAVARLAQLLHSNGREDEARCLLEGITVTNPREAYAWYALGLLLREAGRLENASSYLEHALSLHGCDDTRLALAEVLILQGRSTHALKYLREINTNRLTARVYALLEALNAH